VFILFGRGVSGFGWDGDLVCGVVLCLFCLGLWGLYCCLLW